MTDLAGRKPILCLDFDGVCHSYVSGWKGAHVIPDDPVPGLMEFLLPTASLFDINVFSSRSHQAGGLEAMKDWFEKYFPGMVKALEIKFPLEKPPAFLGIDDRVLTFRGEWPDLAELVNFKPWNKKGETHEQAGSDSRAAEIG